MLGAMCELFVAVGLGCARAGETRTPRRPWQRGGRADLRFVYGAVAIALWQRGRSVARPEQVASDGVLGAGQREALLVSERAHGVRVCASRMRKVAETFAGKVVLITGASSGIGAEAARMFAERGATVVAVARRAHLLDAVIANCRKHTPESFFLAGDVGDRAFAESIVATTLERLGRIDVLVNNAAISKHKHVYHTRAEEAEAVMRINFLSAVWTTFAAIPAMLRQGGGNIVNVSSFAAKVTPPREALYAASKAALSAFTEGLWHDLEGSNIHVVLVHPGPIDTEIWLKEDEPPSYRGKKYPPSIVVQAIFDCIQRRLYEVTVPRRNPMLMSARFLRLAFPSLLRWGMQKADPVPPEVLEKARARSRAGKQLGEVEED